MQLLPQELKLKILLPLKTRSILAMRLVSKEWKEFISVFKIDIAESRKDLKPELSMDFSLKEQITRDYGFFFLLDSPQLPRYCELFFRLAKRYEQRWELSQMQKKNKYAPWGCPSRTIIDNLRKKLDVSQDEIYEELSNFKKHYGFKL